MMAINEYINSQCNRYQITSICNALRQLIHGLTSEVIHSYNNYPTFKKITKKKAISTDILRTELID